MGKNSASIDSLEFRLSQYASDELWERLYTLGTSPAARPRSVSIGLALAAALRASAPTSGINELSLPEDNQLVDLVADAFNISGMQEDYVPADHTEIATVRIEEELFRLIPGLTERPIADLSRALYMAEAVDPLLIECHGFGLINIVRVSAKYVDKCVQYLSSSWKPAPSLELGQEIDLPSSEIRAVQKFLQIDLLQEMELTEADMAALDWMSAEKTSAVYNPGSPSSPFGRYIRFHKSDTNDVDRWVPATYIPEIMAHAVSELLESSPRNESIQTTVRNSHLKQAERHLWRFTDRLIHSSKLGSRDCLLAGAAVDWLLPVNEQTMIAISAVYIEDLQTLEFPEPECLRLARQAMDSQERPSALMSGGKTIRLASGLEIVPIVLVMANSHSTVPQIPGLAVLSLEDLHWISTTAEDEADLYYFAKELAATERPPVFGFEPINFWEVWRNNGKSLYRGGAQPSLLVFAPHSGEAEWERAVELSELEIGLFNTGLPPLRDTQAAEITSENIASVSVLNGKSCYKPITGLRYAPQLDGWSLTLSFPAVAIKQASLDWDTQEKFDFLYQVAGGLVFAFLAIRPEWQEAHADFYVNGYQIDLATQEVPAPTSENVVTNAVRKTAEHPRGVIAATWSFDLENFVEAANGEPAAPNRLTSKALALLLESTGIEEEFQKEVVDSWEASPPFLALEAQRATTHLVRLPEPWKISEADESAAAGALSKRLHEAGVKPGKYEGKEANELIKEHLAPAALDQLESQVQFYDQETLILTGLDQLNRVIDSSTRKQGNLSRVFENLETDWDPYARLTEVSEEALQLRQANEIVIEAVLRAEPSEAGSRVLTEQAWSALLAAANSYLTLTVLSEQLHYRVAPATLEVTATHELQFKAAETTEKGFWNVDFDALNQVGSRLKLAGTPDIDTPDKDPLEDETLAKAMLKDFDASPVDLFDTLIAAVQWESFERNQTTAEVSPAELINWVTSYNGKEGSAQRSRYAEAVKLLTLTSKKIQSSDWSPWKTRTRRHRLLVEPFVTLPNGNLRIAPQYAMVSLSVYRSHLAQGVLPWSSSVPKNLSKALERRRAKRNEAFEVIVERELKGRGFHTLSRIKPDDQARLDIPELSTEIDLICGIPGRSEIWLIEAKDPVSLHGHPEIARQLETFFRDSKRKGRTKPCYASQLTRKDSEVRPYLDQVAKKLELGDVATGEPRNLRSLFITRILTPAGFVQEKHKVLSISEFLTWLDKEYTANATW